MIISRTIKNTFAMLIFFGIIWLLPFLLYAKDKLRSTGFTATYNQIFNPDVKRWPREKVKYLEEPTIRLQSPCSDKECYREKWNMIILVKSSAENLIRRNLIRESWGSMKHLNGGGLQTIFIIGRSEYIIPSILDAEIRINEDVLLIDVEDTYRNVVLKTLAGMQWASENLSDRYFLSTSDDDVFIDVARMQEIIERYHSIYANTLFPIICMYKMWEDPGYPDRHPKSKYYVSKEQYEPDIWPKFCPGGMYTLSMAVANEMWEMSRNTEILPVDDVWITGILRKKVGISDSMIVPTLPPVAKHFRGFNGIASHAKFEKMWHSLIFDLNKNSTNCLCD